MPGPHDLFARFTFGHPERAAAELHAVLPPHVVSAVDWSSLRREPGSVVDPELRETESWVGDKAAHQAAGRVLHSVLDAQGAEALMRSYGEELIEQGREQGLAQGREQGRLRGRAEAVLQILAARGIHVGDEAQQRILSCSDMAMLDRWFARSLNATHLSDVLEGLAS
jgi:predicted transposase YdaD